MFVAPSGFLFRILFPQIVVTPSGTPPLHAGNSSRTTQGTFDYSVLEMQTMNVQACLCNYLETYA